MKNIIKLQTGIMTLVALLTSLAVQAQERTLDVNVDVDKGGGDMWYANPWVWVVGAAVFILLLAAILRSGGRTSD